MWLIVIMLISIINICITEKSVQLRRKYGIFHFTESVNLRDFLQCCQQFNTVTDNRNRKKITRPEEASRMRCDTVVTKILSPDDQNYGENTEYFTLRSS